MKVVKSVFRGPDGETILDPAEQYVKQFNKILGFFPGDTATLLDHIAEQIMDVRLKQDNVIYEGSETANMYHERGRWQSGITYEPAHPTEDDNHE